MDTTEAAGKRILRFMRSVPRLRVLVQHFLQTVPPTRESCLNLGRRLLHLCEAWRQNVPERLYHIVLGDLFVLQDPRWRKTNPLARHLVEAADQLLLTLRLALDKKRLPSSHGQVAEMATFRAQLDETVRAYLREHTSYHLQREGRLVRQLVAAAANNQEEHASLVQAEIERCYGHEVVVWARRMSLASQSHHHPPSTKVKIWHACLLDRNFEMVFIAQDDGPGTTTVASRKGSPQSPIKVNCIVSKNVKYCKKCV